MGDEAEDAISAEVARLENDLTQAEYRYTKDVSKLQQALLRAKQLKNIHLVGLHLRMYPLVEAAHTVPVEKAFYKWKAGSSIDRNYKFEKTLRLMRHFTKKLLTRAFISFRERAKQAPLEKKLQKPVYSNGALPPILPPDDDELELF